MVHYERDLQLPKRSGVVEIVKALVLAGGKGTRLRPLTYTLAKQLVPVANRPVIHYVMDHLEEAGIQEVGVIVAPETGGQIKDALAQNPWKFDFQYLLQEEPLGLAHTLVIAREFLGDERFVMYLGDNLIGQGIRGLVEEFQCSQADAMVLLKKTPDPSQFGVAVLADDGSIRQLVEKPKQFVSDLAMVGVYCFSPGVHEAVARISPSGRGELEITDAIQYLLENGYRVIGQQLETWWLDCGKKDDLLEANRVVLDEWTKLDIRGEVDESSRLVGRVVVEEGSNIQKSEIRGPSIVGSNSLIKETFIGPYTSIGRNCQIVNSILEYCVVLDGAQIQGVQRLEDSVIGRNAIVRRDADNHRGTSLMIGDNNEVLL